MKNVVGIINGYCYAPGRHGSKPFCNRRDILSGKVAALQRVLYIVFHLAYRSSGKVSIQKSLAPFLPVFRMARATHDNFALGEKEIV